MLALQDSTVLFRKSSKGTLAGSQSTMRLEKLGVFILITVLPMYAHPFSLQIGRYVCLHQLPSQLKWKDVEQNYIERIEDIVYEHA